MYYNDAFLGNLLIIYLLSLIYFSFESKGKYASAAYAVTAMSACLAMNVKFSGLIFCGLFGAAFYFFWLISGTKNAGFRAGIRNIKKITIMFAVIVL